MAQIFTFTLASFNITETRSRHDDTDYVSFTLLVKSSTGSGTPKTLTKSMGDVNNGVHNVNLSFPNIAIDPSETVVLNYLIVNSGHKSPSEVESGLETAGTKLAVAGATALGGAIGSVIPGFGTILGGAVGFLAGELTGLLDADCDGAVAAEQDTLVYNDLIARTANGTFSQETKHPGTDSPSGCGSNSVYYVTWFMQSHPS
jgi:hypothetical protein